MNEWQEDGWQEDGWMDEEERKFRERFHECDARMSELKVWLEDDVTGVPTTHSWLRDHPDEVRRIVFWAVVAASADRPPCDLTLSGVAIARMMEAATRLEVRDWVDSVEQEGAKAIREAESCDDLLQVSGDEGGHSRGVLARYGLREVLEGEDE